MQEKEKALLEACMNDMKKFFDCEYTLTNGLEELGEISQDFVNALLKFNPKAYNNLPIDNRTFANLLLTFKYVEDHEYVDVECIDIDSYIHLLSDKENVKSLLKINPQVIKYCKEELLTATLVQSVISENIKSNDYFTLDYVPRKYISYDVCMDAISFNSDNASYIPSEFWDIDLFNVFIKSGGEASNIDNIPNKYFDEYSIRKLIDVNVHNFSYLRYKTKDFMSTFDYAISKGASFTSYYSILDDNIKTKENLLHFYNRGYYCGTMPKDMYKLEIDFNPIEMFLRTTHNKGLYKHYAKWLLNTYTFDQLQDFYNELNIKINHIQSKVIEEYLLINIDKSSIKRPDHGLFIGSGIEVLRLSDNQVYKTTEISDTLPSDNIEIVLKNHQRKILNGNEYTLYGNLFEVMNQFVKCQTNYK